MSHTSPIAPATQTAIQSVTQTAGTAPPAQHVSPIRPPRTSSAPIHATPSPHGLLLSIQALLLLIIVAVFIVAFAVQPFRIPSASMVPTLLVGDFLLVDKQTATLDHLPLAPGKLRRGDVIVFHYPPNPAVHLVKRVIGLPGERVRLHDDHVFINGQPLAEPYAIYRPSPPDPYRDDFPRLTSTDPDVDSHWWMELRHLVDHGELRIPANQYFVLGDNRNNSEDSRYWGLVPAGAVVGRPLLVYLSLREPENTAAEDDRNRAARPADLWSNLRSLARWQRALHIVR